jgi:hypothetical protein
MIQIGGAIAGASSGTNTQLESADQGAVGELRAQSGLGGGEAELREETAEIAGAAPIDAPQDRGGGIIRRRPRS